MMYKDNIAQMFTEIFKKIKQDDFLNMSSLNGEIPFWIASYNPEQENEVAKAYSGLLRKTEKQGIKILDLNLYDIAMQLLEEHLGRELKFYGYKNKNNEVCHHIDRNKLNNDISNLQLMTESEHIKLHHKDGDYNRDSKGRIIK